MAWTINNGKLYFNSKLYTGNGGTNVVTGVGFNSDFTWIKNRVKEISTWSGVSLIAVGLLWIFAGSLFTWVAYLAVAWGIFSIVKKQG